MNSWLFLLELKSDDGTTVELKTPKFPEGKKFDRWARGELKIVAGELRYLLPINLEHSDASGLAEILSAIQPNQRLQWLSIEDRLSIDFEASSLGAVTVLLSVKNPSGPIRRLEIAVAVTLPEIEMASAKLNRAMSGG